MYKMANKEIATFGAGCFWCVEAVFQRLQGVEKVVSGYMGGKNPNPTYKEICTGTSGHAEVTQIEYDPSIITYEELLEVLWTTHDPTTLNQQGNDRGTQYRSAVFYHSEDQKSKALKSIEEVASKLYDEPIVTEVTEAPEFYPAEKYHQDYFNSNSYVPYCRFVVAPKVTKLRNKFSHKLKENA